MRGIVCCPALSLPLLLLPDVAGRRRIGCVWVGQQRAVPFTPASLSRSNLAEAGTGLVRVGIDAAVVCVTREQARPVVDSGVVVELWAIVAGSPVGRLHGHDCPSGPLVRCLRVFQAPPSSLLSDEMMIEAILLPVFLSRPVGVPSPPVLARRKPVHRVDTGLPRHTWLLSRDMSAACGGCAGSSIRGPGCRWRSPLVERGWASPTTRRSGTAPWIGRPGGRGSGRATVPSSATAQTNSATTPAVGELAGAPWARTRTLAAIPFPMAPEATAPRSRSSR